MEGSPKRGKCWIWDRIPIPGSESGTSAPTAFTMGCRLTGGCKTAEILIQTLMRYHNDVLRSRTTDATMQCCQIVLHPYNIDNLGIISPLSRKRTTKQRRMNPGTQTEAEFE